MDGSEKFKSYIGKPYMPLFKYYSNPDYVKDAILNNRIHLEKPCDYNDIYDSSFYMNKDSLSVINIGPRDNALKALERSLPVDDKERINKTDLTTFEENDKISKLMDIFCKQNPDVNRESIENNFIQLISNNKLQQAPNIRLSCFSERNDSLLMWAYYANNYRGYCVEFDMSLDETLKNNLHKVQYSRCYENHFGTFDNYFIKAESWQHEQEWRIAIETEDEFLPTSAVKALYIGPRAIKEEYFKEILLPCQNIEFDIYMVKPNLSEYKLDFEKIN